MKGHIYPIAYAISAEFEFEEEDRRGLKDCMRSLDELEDADRRGLKDRRRFLSGRLFFLGFFGLGFIEPPSTRPLILLL